MITIGITGGVGCGKTKILGYIKDNYNCRIITADEVANRLKEPGEACYEPLIKLLGEKILKKDGFIDKKKMAEAIFANDDILDEVNSIIHPAVENYILNAKESEEKAGIYDYLFIEAALLIECGYNKHVDHMWYIYTAESIRIERLINSRGYREEKIRNIMDAQLSEEQFRAGSDFCIDNSGALEETYMQIKKKMKELESEDGRK